MKPGHFVGGLVIFFCIAITAMALSGSVRRTVTFQEALASQQPCEIYGEVVKNSTAMQENGRFSFALREQDTNQIIHVTSLKPKPGNFEQASHVKAIGTAKGGEFIASDMLVKCPSKYQGADGNKTGYASAGAEASADAQKAALAPFGAAPGQASGSGR